MNPFVFKNGRLHAEKIALDKIARKAGTPCYVYSATALLDNFRNLTSSLAGIPHLICYSVKANSNLTLLRMLARRNSGFDIVSGGELYRVQKAGGRPDKVVFSGVGKTEAEMEQLLTRYTTTMAWTDFWAREGYITEVVRGSERRFTLSGKAALVLELPD